MDKSARDTSKPAKVWNEIFDKPEYIFGIEPNDYLVGKKEYFRPGQKVLMVADGEGRNSVWAAGLGLNVDAFDLSEKAVEKAKKLAAQKGVSVSYFVSGVDEWDWPEETYDVVVVIFVQFATPNMRTRLFANCVKTLKKGGMLILQGYSPKQLEYKTGGPPILDHLYTEKMLREYFSTMEIKELKEYDAYISEGPRHTGMSGLIGMVAEKTDKKESVEGMKLIC